MLNVVLIILLVISVAILVYKVRTKHEHFTQQLSMQNILQGIGVEKCGILQPSGSLLEDPLVANIYKSGRLKEWKPLKATTFDKNLDYCSIDRDDYILAEEVCSKDNPMFKDIPFISDVFSSDENVATKYKDSNECVFKIEKDLVDDASKALWWSKWQNQSECDKVNASLKEKNVKLNEELTTIQKLKTDIENELFKIKKDNAALTSSINTDEISINQLKGDYETKRNKYMTILQKLNSLRDKYISLQATEEPEMVSLRNSYNQITEEFDNISKEWTKIKKEYDEQLLSITDKKTSLKDKKNQNVRFTDEQLKPMMQKYNDLKRNIDIKQNELNACDASKKRVAIEFDACQKELVPMKIMEADKRKEYEICNANLISCGIDKATAESRLRDEKIKLKQITIDNDTCQSQLRTCLANYETKRGQYEKEKVDYTNTRIRLPYESCEEYKKKVEAINTNIRDCNLDVTEVKNLKADIKVAQEVLEQISDSDCQNKRSQLPSKYRLDHLIPCNTNEKEACTACPKTCSQMNQGSFDKLFFPDAPFDKENACYCNYAATELDKKTTDDNNNSVVANWLYRPKPIILAGQTDYACGMSGLRTECTFRANYGLSGKYGQGKAVLAAPSACHGKTLVVNDAFSALSC